MVQKRENLINNRHSPKENLLNSHYKAHRNSSRAVFTYSMLVYDGEGTVPIRNRFISNIPFSLVVWMMLPDWKIRKDILIEPFSEKSLQPAGYDLRVGEEAYLDGRLIDVGKDGNIIIPPKAHALVLTLERVKLPDDVMGDMKIRSSLAREGLLGSFAWVDPGWDGNLTLVIFNSSSEPVELTYGERFVQIAFHHLEGPSQKPYRGNYQGSRHLALSKRKKR